MERKRRDRAATGPRDRNRDRGTAVVAGAGIFGVTAAVELRRRGWSVALVAPAPVPHPLASSTDRSKVIRMDYGRDESLSRLAQEAMDGWVRWNRAFFSRPLFHRTGFLLLSREPLAPGGFEADSMASLAARNVPAERISPGALRDRYPEWNAEVYPDGYLSPTAGWAESGRVVGALVREAGALGVQVVAGRLTAVETAGGRVAGVRVEGPDTGGDEAGAVAETFGEPARQNGPDRRLPCDLLVLAAGAWTPGLLDRLGLGDPGREAGGEPAFRASGMPVLLFAPRDPSPFRAERFPVWGADIARTGWYGFPAGPDGVVKIGHHGAGVAADPDDPGLPGEGWETRCRDFLAESIPALADAPLAGSRICFYCDTRDGDFWITRHPGVGGLVLATGGSGHGFKFGPLLGSLTADAAEGVENPRLERFRWRPGGSAGAEHARCTADGSAG